MLDNETTERDNSDRTMMVSASDTHDLGVKQRASLIVLAGWEIGREIELTGDEHVFGRSPQATTSINLPSISRQHARIEKVQEAGKDTFVIFDLNSSNGTRVNNVPITSARLNPTPQISSTSL